MIQHRPDVQLDAIREPAVLLPQQETGRARVLRPLELDKPAREEPPAKTVRLQEWLELRHFEAVAKGVVLDQPGPTGKRQLEGYSCLETLQQVQPTLVDLADDQYVVQAHNYRPGRLSEQRPVEQLQELKQP